MWLFRLLLIKTFNMNISQYRLAYIAAMKWPSDLSGLMGRHFLLHAPHPVQVSGELASHHPQRAGWGTLHTSEVSSLVIIVRSWERGGLTSGPNFLRADVTFITLTHSLLTRELPWPYLTAKFGITYRYWSKKIVSWITHRQSHKLVDLT